MTSRWRTADVWAIALSACTADLGYQAVLAGFPLLLVLDLHQPVWELGLATALAYGGGALWSYVGGRLGDRVGHRRLAIAGNAAIPLLSLCGLLASPAWAIGLFCGGWWARNLRSPSRRSLLVDAVPTPDDRAAAFGFLHALDVGGGALAAVGVLAGIAVHVPLRWLFLATAVPLVVSTALLTRTGADRRPTARPPAPAPPATTAAPTTTAGPGGPPSPARPAQPVSERRRATTALLVAAVLYGFTSYSAAFPVLTVAQRTRAPAAGVGAFLVLLASSAMTGTVLGGRLGRTVVAQLRRLGLLGYGLAAVGSGLVAVAVATASGVGLVFAGVVLVGVALGVVETLEPTLMAVLRGETGTGRAMGALSAARGGGTFVANLAMGLLYGLGAGAAYSYAAATSALAAVTVVAATASAPAEVLR